MDTTNESPTLAVLRKVLLGIFSIAVAGTLIELLLLEHFDGATQLIPLILLTISLLVLAWFGFAPSRTSLRAFQIVSILLIVGGTTGLLLHYNGNMLFELSVTPEMKGSDLFWKSVTGATPALAPGAMIQFGLLGLASTFRHPMWGAAKKPYNNERAAQ